ncbi:MAG: NADH-quinone oxidoreductase subunit L [Verrucomicrobiota bacterium]
MFDKPENIAWLILLLPLVAAAITGLFTQKNQKLSAMLSIAASAAAFLVSLILFFGFSEPDKHGIPITPWSWISVGDLKIDIGLKLDALSKMMLLIVTGVGTAIHVFSYSYMHEDRCFSRFFSHLSLFMFSMLGIVLADNLLMMFIFWELVGVSSYLLIGFWYEKPSAGDAAKKAFLTNRIGDFGFILGILVVWGLLGTLNFQQLEMKLVKDPAALGAMATAAGLLLFCGAMGKSAQFPLHVWLPDAMEGPTPVSALIHAATMVAAGVYMLCRVFFILNVTGSEALIYIAWIGGVTALLAALMAVQQNDIKRILAYSTLSQLGYMVMAVGLHAPGAAMFHLTTHAFFKAMLFLGAASVIHALHHEQDIWKMGGLKERMPITFWTFAIGTLALCGVPPFSGFYSKDEILAAAADLAHHGSIPLFVIAALVAVLTTFYMGRLFFVAFLGKAKSESADHAHESPALMTLPLQFLAVLSVVAGIIGISGFYGHFFGHEHHSSGFPNNILEPFGHAPVAAFSGLAAVGIGGLAAFLLYNNATSDKFTAKFKTLSKLMSNRFYFDELYEKLIKVSQEALASFADAVDRWIIAGLLVRGVHGGTELTGRVLRLVQSGNLQTYAFLFALGAAIVMFLTLAR